MATASELPIDTSASAMDLANSMFGNGIDVQSAAFVGAANASGIYSDGDAVAPGATPSDTGVILSTGDVTSYTNSSGDVNTSAGTTTNHSLAGDSDLTSVAGATTFDAAVFTAEFIPDGSTLTMQLVFSSEEYLEYVNSGFNDAVGVYVNGVKAELGFGDGDITINNINDQSNANLYLDNPASADNFNTEMDGLTVTMTLKAPVNPDALNTIKIAIADGGDAAYDSNLLIAGDSVQTQLIAQDDEFDISLSGSKNVDILDNDTSEPGSTLTITHINNQPVSVGDVITLPSGETVELMPDGTIQVTSDGSASDNIFTYTVADDLGNTDVGYVNVTTAPCFVAGTQIKTTRGLIPVEDLEPGTPVITKDHGICSVTWVGMSTLPALGRFAPIEIAAGTFCDHEKTRVSPNHRVLLTSGRAQLLFSTSEVLVRAKDLVNDTTVRRIETDAPVTYVHILFNQHEIVWGDGLQSESYQPGDISMDAFDAQTQEEVFALFPDLRCGGAYGPAARRALKRFEALALIT
ncbi:MAG: choice-of-anchor L domain-containing protein [Pseudomonadota bacterium]